MMAQQKQSGFFLIVKLKFSLKRVEPNHRLSVTHHLDLNLKDRATRKQLACRREK
jgi:hypothetical protein